MSSGQDRTTSPMNSCLHETCTNPSQATPQHEVRRVRELRCGQVTDSGEGAVGGCWQVEHPRKWPHTHTWAAQRGVHGFLDSKSEDTKSEGRKVTMGLGGAEGQR